MATVCDSLEYRIAEQQVDDFAREDGDEFAREGHSVDNEECETCDALLQIGIKAFYWLQRAEDTIREASYLGLLEFTPELKGAIGRLYQKWLVPCTRAEEWADSLMDRGHRPKNLDRLLECKAMTLDQIQHQEWLNLAHQARMHRFAEEAW